MQRINSFLIKIHNVEFIIWFLNLKYALEYMCLIKFEYYKKSGTTLVLIFYNASLCIKMYIQYMYICNILKHIYIYIFSFN